MMDSVRLFLRNFIKYFLYIAVFAQIVTGTVYLVYNFTEYIVYPETEEMVHVAKGLLFDEYTGVLYPLFIRLCLFVQSLTGTGYYLVAHLIQLLLVGVSALYLVKAFCKGKKAWIVMAYILSFPMCMQTILMVSPFAFKAAFSFVMLGSMLRLWRGKKKVMSWCVLVVAYVLAAFNVTDDLYMWLIPVGVFVMAYIVKNRRTLKIWKSLCLFLVTALVFVGSLGVLNNVTEAGARGRMQRTVSSVLFQRTLWPRLWEKYGFLPMDIKACIPKHMAVESDGYSEKIVYIIGAKVDKEVGFERANELYMESFLNQMSYNKRAFLRNVWEDFTGYLMTPYGTIKYLAGQEGACFSSLYGPMNAPSPKFVYFYFCIGFVSLFVTTFDALLEMIKKKLFVKKVYIKRALILGTVLAYQALWYSVANVQGVDYRYGIFNIALFSIFALSGEFLESHSDRKESGDGASLEYIMSDYKERNAK